MDFQETAELSTSRSTCVVVPDGTRPAIYLELLRDLVRILHRGGSPTTVLVALGLHRPMTVEELRPLRSALAGTECRLLQHDPMGDDLVHRGIVHGHPALLHRAVMAAERVICVGTVEPHQYAGFSGGIKAVAIGCAGAPTISAMHGLELLRDPRTTLGRVQDNPFQSRLWEIADLPHALGLQLVPGTDQVFFGALPEAFQKACQVARQTFFRPVEAPLDWLHLTVPPTKATNFYQASRAATYAALVQDSALRPGGLIIVEAPCPEGMGHGAGERACQEAMQRGRDVLIDELRGDQQIPLRGGQQRAYVLAQATRQCTIALVGAPPIDALEPMGIAQFDTPQQALKVAKMEDRPGLKIDNIFHSIPRLASP